MNGIHLNGDAWTVLWILIAVVVLWLVAVLVVMFLTSRRRSS